MPTLRLAALLVLAVAPALVAQQAPRTLRVVDLGGTPYERGLQHGKALAPEIRTMVARFEADLPTSMGEPAATLIPRFLAATRYEDAIRRFTPGLLDEVRGIADGAGLPYETMLVYQLIDEQWAQAPSLRREKCTSVGLASTGDQPTIVAQNLDIPEWMHAYPTVLRIQHSDSDLQSLVVTLPGLIGAMGMNSGKVALAVNTILQLAPRRDGLPVAFVVRGVLAEPDDAAARAFLQRVTHACGQAYTIGGPTEVTCHEASAHGIAAFVPAGGTARVWHTNHPVASTDWNPDFVAAAAAKGKEPAQVRFACSRFAQVETVLGKQEPVDAARLVALFADPSAHVCNPGTYVCAVMTLGDQPELRVSPGPASTAKLQTVTFAKPR